MEERALEPGARLELELGDAEVRGFGVRFAPLEPNDVWRLRTTNRAYGHQAYAPSGHFSVGDDHFTWWSGGDDLVEHRPPDAPGSLRITAGPTGAILRERQPAPVAVRPGTGRGAWHSGTWVGLDQRRVLADLDELVESGLEFTGRLVDAGWYDHEGELLAPGEAFPDLEGLVARHVEAGLAVCLWVAPWVPVDTPQWSWLRARGWLVGDDAGEPLVFPVVGDGVVVGSYVDLSARAPAAAWAAAVAGLRAIGVSAIKLDFGEALPDRAVLRGEVDVEGTDPPTRNHFPLFAQHATAAGLGPDGFLMSRAGWTGSERVSANWIGDQSSDRSRFAGLGSTVHALRSGIESGYSRLGLDLGGYFGLPDAPTMRAWQRTAALFDFGTYHGLTERRPWRMGREAVESHRRLVRLWPELGWSAGDLVEVGNLEDRVVAQRVGTRAVAVADLLLPAAVRLPEGRWRDVDTGKVHEGPATLPCDGGSVFVEE